MGFFPETLWVFVFDFLGCCLWMWRVIQLTQECGQLQRGVGLRLLQYLGRFGLLILGILILFLQWISLIEVCIITTYWYYLGSNLVVTLWVQLHYPLDNLGWREYLFDWCFLCVRWWFNWFMCDFIDDCFSWHTGGTW